MFSKWKGKKFTYKRKKIDRQRSIKKNNRRRRSLSLYKLKIKPNMIPITTKKVRLKNLLYIIRKRHKIENYIKFLTKMNVEIKLKNFIKSSRSSKKFKIVYKNFYDTLRLNKINLFNRQFKEIYASLSLGMYLSKAQFLVNLFAIVIGYGRYRLLKKNLYYLFSLVECLQSIYCRYNSIRINISGKFKGKAKRTQLKYLKTSGL